VLNICFSVKINNYHPPPSAEAGVIGHFLPSIYLGINIEYLLKKRIRIFSDIYPDFRVSRIDNPVYAGNDF